MPEQMEVMLNSSEVEHLILAVAKLAEQKEDSSGRHLENIMGNSALLAKALKKHGKFADEIDDTFIKMIKVASALHDIGKTAISDTILLKPSRLNEAEMKIVRTHTEIGGKMLQDCYETTGRHLLLKMASEIAFYHHEKWDGKGYPKGLKGDEIPLAAQIVAVVDVYDALTNKRCYKDAYSHEKSMEIIKAEQGKSFDADIVNVLSMVQDELLRG